MPHRLGNATSGVTRILLLTTPAGFDAFVRTAGERVEDPATPHAPMTGAPIGQLDQTALRHGITVVDESEL